MLRHFEIPQPLCYADLGPQVVRAIQFPWNLEQSKHNLKCYWVKTKSTSSFLLTLKFDSIDNRLFKKIGCS